MFSLSPNVGLLALVILLVYTRPTLAFGAGNVAQISSVEGVNWRHGDIEDILLTILLARGAGGKKFSKLNVSRVYFGNWLRDYSQAIDVGTVKSVSAEAIRLLLSVLGFMTFGYGSKEFEVTAERLGCYRPEDHIDNPKNYADKVDARQYDKRLRGPVNERVELAIDKESGMKNYIANETLKTMSSAKHVRNLFTKCIELGRRSNGDDADFYEALRLLGTGLHCLEDFFAHSNYTELALIELGEADIFPHVGRETKLTIPGASEPVYPLVTGTFGGVDFLHSVTGEVSDKLTQNEIEELEGTLQNASASSNDSVLEDVFNMIPDGSGKKEKMNEIQDNAHNSQLGNAKISPRDPEEYTVYAQQCFAQIMPAIEFHDNLMKDLTKAVESIPLLGKILERFEERMSMWVFTIIAPFVIPVIGQVKSELHTGSNEIIESSKREQHIVFEDDKSSDPTHSMLSKDHFSNILNEIAGKTAQKVVGWVVPLIMNAWDDDGVDVHQLTTRIINGILHHPAQREEGKDGAEEGRRLIFSSVEEWWKGMSDDAKEEHRRKLSREGVENAENHKEGVHDTGHGCGGPLGMHNNFAKGGTLEDRIAANVADAIVDHVTGQISNIVKTQAGVDLPQTNKSGSGGDSGGIGGYIGSFFGGGSSGDQETTTTTRREETYETRNEGSESYSKYERREERQGDNSGSYGYEERTETRRGYGEENTERTERAERYESREESYGGNREESYGGGYGGRRNQDESEGYGSSRRDENEGYSGRQESGGYGGRQESGGYGGRQESGGYGGRQESGGYGGRDENEGYSGRRDEGENEGYGRRRDDGEEYSSRRNDEYDGGNDSGRRRRDNEGEGGWGY